MASASAGNFAIRRAIIEIKSPQRASMALMRLREAAQKVAHSLTFLLRPKASSSRSAARESPLVLAIVCWNLRAFSR
jgi:hypothetical protein